MRIKADMDIIDGAIIDLKQKAKADRRMRIYANTQLARYCDPYVPASPSRIMSANINITAEYVQYPGPYAHYQWAGIVYSPNIPIFEGETLVGFFSPPGKPKTKTDRKLKYSRDTHPLAQSHWEEAAMARHKGDLENDIKRYIADRFGGKEDV